MSEPAHPRRAGARRCRRGQGPRRVARALGRLEAQADARLGEQVARLQRRVAELVPQPAEVAAMVPVLAVFGLVRLALTGLTGLLIVYAILSWVQTYSPVQEVLQRLCEPVLRPVRRVMPLVGGVDLSPLVALVVLNVATMVLGHLQAAVLGQL